MQQRRARARVRSLPLRKVSCAQESVGSVTGAEEEGGHRARGSAMRLKYGHWPSSNIEVTGE